MPGNRAEPISNIQVLRGLAALGVVFYHTDYRLPGDVHTNFQGVSIFFVISGFIMTYITRENTTGFFTKRIVRIVPLYWIATIASALWLGLAFNNVAVYPMLLRGGPAAAIAWLAGQWNGLAPVFSSEWMIKSLLFIPQERHPYLAVGWTLNIEMFFYAVFGLALLAGRRAAPFLASAALVAAYSANTSCGPVCAQYGHDDVLFFIMGIACFYVWQVFARWAERNTRVIALASLAFVAFALWLNLSDAERAYWSHYTLPAGWVLCALLLHSAGFRCRVRPVLILGDASFALYLFHPIVIDTVRTAVPVNSFNGMLLALVASIAVGWAVHAWVERPLLRWLKPRSAPSRRDWPRDMPPASPSRPPQPEPAACPTPVQP